MTWTQILQIVAAVLSVPTVAAATTWLARRFSKEARLTIRLERLSAIYPNLPTGTIRDEFGKRVADAGAELCARLDPLFKQERRRKRRVVVGLVLMAALVVLIYPGQASAGLGWTSVTGFLLGGVAVGAFLLIERDTRRQRAAIAREQQVEVQESTAQPPSASE